jgi:hypothetical protein
MKGRKRHHKEGGGGTGGADEAEEDIKEKPAPRTVPSNVSKESQELKKGGRAHKARGGKSVGVISGPEPPAHAGRKPRKSGGRSGSEKNPFTSANKGKDPKGHKTGGASKNPLEGENESA